MLRIFYADSPIPRCWTPLKSGSHQAGRDTSLMAVSFAFNQIHSCQFLLLTRWVRNMLHQQTRAFPVWSRVCCIFLSHSSLVHTVDLWFHFINIQTCCSRKKDKHVYCLSLLPLFLLSLSFCKTFHKNEIQFPLLNFSKYLVENEFTWSFTDWCTPVIEHDHVPGILFVTRNKKTNKTRFLPLKSLQNVLFGRDQHGSKKRGWSS